MAMIHVLNQEISIQSLDDLKKEKLLSSIKSEIVKNSILESLRYYIKSENVPNEFLGFLLSIESEIKKCDLTQITDMQLLFWFEELVQRIQKRELLYDRWQKNTQGNKLSIILNQVKSRVFSDKCMNKIKRIINEAHDHLRNQLELEMISRTLSLAIELYEKTAYWPRGETRYKQQQELLLFVNQAPNAFCAMNILTQGIMQIEQHHVLHSLAANCPYYQTKSRLATHLHLASRTLSQKIIHSKSNVELNIEEAINHYLNEDFFYHNRKRRSVAQQLLMQLHADNIAFGPGQELQRKNKLRSTLDYYIDRINDDFKKTYFFSRFYSEKRSRLSRYLELAKARLIMNNQLTTLELERDIKTPIIKFIMHIIDHDDVDVDIIHEMNSLLQAIKEAQTPPAIEAILASHVRSYLLENTKRHAIGLKLEAASLTWQTQGLLPATSEYKAYLEKQALNHQNKESHQVTDGMREKSRVINEKAKSLLKRIQNLP